jgi:GrpB-like predicted nucleotidyltransferase (UPF0157 family)
LRDNASLRQAYNHLKAEWNGRPMDDYRAAKRAFIEAALKTDGVNMPRITPIWPSFM